MRVPWTLWRKIWKRAKRRYGCWARFCGKCGVFGKRAPCYGKEKDQGQAARQAGIPPFRAREFMQHVQRWKEPHLRQAWTAFAHADSALKGGRASQPKLILDDLVIQLCKGKQRQSCPMKIVRNFKKIGTR